VIVELIAVMAVLGHGTYLRMTTTDSFSEFRFPFMGYLRLVSPRRLNHGIFHHQDCGPKIPPWRYHHQPKGMNRQYPNGVLIHNERHTGHCIFISTSSSRIGTFDSKGSHIIPYE